MSTFKAHESTLTDKMSHSVFPHVIINICCEKKKKKNEATFPNVFKSCVTSDVILSQKTGAAGLNQRKMKSPTYATHVSEPALNPL